MKTRLLSFLLCVIGLFTTNSLSAQLNPGDIAIIYYHADNSPAESFSFCCPLLEEWLTNNILWAEASPKIAMLDLQQDLEIQLMPCWSISHSSSNWTPSCVYELLPRASTKQLPPHLLRGFVCRRSGATAAGINFVLFSGVWFQRSGSVVVQVASWWWHSRTSHCFAWSRVS